MRISVVAGGLRAIAPGGLPWRYLTEAATGLAALGHDVEFVTDGPLALDLPGVPTWYPTKGERGDPPHSLGDHLRADRPHVVIWNTTAASAVHARSRVLAGTRHIALFAGPSCVGSPGAHHRLTRFSDRSFAEGLGALLPRRRLTHVLEHSFESVIVPSQSIAEGLFEAGLPAERMRLVLPGRDRDIAPRSDPWAAVQGEVRFIVADDPTCGRDLDFVLRAFEEIRTIAPNVRLLTGSIDPTMDRADRLARLGSADVIVLPPRLASDEVPFAVLDAAGVGLPLVAPDVASVRDVAAPGSLLFAPGSREALRTAVLRFATDVEVRVSAATSARDWFEAWPTWRETTRQLAGAIGLADLAVDEIGPSDDPAGTEAPGSDERPSDWPHDVSGSAA